MVKQNIIYEERGRLMSTTWVRLSIYVMVALLAVNAVAHAAEHAATASAHVMPLKAAKVGFLRRHISYLGTSAAAGAVLGLSFAKALTIKTGAALLLANPGGVAVLSVLAGGLIANKVGQMFRASGETTLLGTKNVFHEQKLADNTHKAHRVAYLAKTVAAHPEVLSGINVNPWTEWGLRRAEGKVHRAIVMAKNALMTKLGDPINNNDTELAALKKKNTELESVLGEIQKHHPDLFKADEGK